MALPSPGRRWLNRPERGTRPWQRGRLGLATDGGEGVMDRLVHMLAGLLERVAGLLGEGRRDWVHALLAENR